ncbi:MAG TPA: helix-turn-helix domain-containing protein [Polyangiales bacterium]|nr:helix-turn-helix domain-containing protein [Polyangiales bacterium]
MRWNEAADQYCSIARTLGILGDRWTLLIIREAFNGVRRFDDFRKHLDVARNVLTDRLQRLVDAGVLVQQPYQDNPPRNEYRLTASGRDLQPLLIALMQWGDRWLADGKGAPIELEHVGCGHVTTAKFVCGHCGEPLEARNTRMREGPGLPKAVAEERAREVERLRAQRS